MNENSKGWRIAMLCGVVLVSAACSPANKEIGSACMNGVCPGALVKQGPVCSAAQVSFEFDTSSPAVMCLPRPLPKDDDGKVQCRALWRQNLTPRRACSDLPFLSPGPDELDCLVHQVSASSADASMGEGWYYDEDDHDCPDPSLAIRFTEGVLQSGSEATVRIDCDTLRMADPDATEADAGSSPNDPSECILPKDSARHASSVGDSCVPKLVPEGGFHEHELYVESGSGQCDTGACLVYHLRGDPRPECSGASGVCASPAKVEELVYCSMRCDDHPERCPEGFTCQEDALSNGPEGLRGGYCIRIPK